MSFLKKLFGGKSSSDSGPKNLAEETYNGFTIRALEMKAGSEFQLCGDISKEIDGVMQVHHFIRADRIAGVEQAAKSGLAKGRQIVDEQGDAIFKSSH